MDINQYSPRSGRVIRENNEILNELDLLLDQNSDAGIILTTTPLADGASYTQAGQDRLNRSPVVNRVKGEAWADQAGTLYLEESEDNSTWTATRTVAVSAGVTAQVPWTILTKRYFRFRYVNGANAQTGFILVQQTGGPGMRNTVLTGRKVALVNANYNQVLNVAAGGTVTITITPPAGELWRLKVLVLWIPAVSGSTTGTHFFKVRLGVSNDHGNILYNQNAYNGSINVYYNRLSQGTTKYPGTEDAQQRAILNAVVSNSCPLYIYYSNNTDVAQTGNLELNILREVEYIVS